jgi:hypothetical protein
LGPPREQEFIQAFQLESKGVLALFVAESEGCLVEVLLNTQPTSSLVEISRALGNFTPVQSTQS